MIRRSSNHWKFWVVLFPIIGTCALANFPGGMRGFFSAWYGVSTKFDPNQITSIYMWFDAQDASTLTITTNNFVSRWNDKSINSHSLTQATTANFPLYTNSVLFFDGTNDVMSSAYLSWPSNLTFYIVSSAISNSLDGTGRAWATIKKSGDNNGYMHLVYRNDISSYVRYLFSSDGSGADQYILTLTNNYQFPSASIFGMGIGTNIWFSHNGFEQTNRSGVAISATNALLRIGTYFNDSPSTYYLRGNVHEIVVVGASSDTLTRQKIEGYLAHKWSLTGNLPTNHPYKVTAP